MERPRLQWKECLGNCVLKLRHERFCSQATQSFTDSDRPHSLWLLRNSDEPGGAKPAARLRRKFTGSKVLAEGPQAPSRDSPQSPFNALTRCTGFKREGPPLEPGGKERSSFLTRAGCTSRSHSELRPELESAIRAVGAGLSTPVRHFRTVDNRKKGA